MVRYRLTDHPYKQAPGGPEPTPHHVKDWIRTGGAVQLSKLEGALKWLSCFHQSTMQLARFDLNHIRWMNDHNSPGGIVVVTQVSSMPSTYGEPLCRAETVKPWPVATMQQWSQEDLPRQTLLMYQTQTPDDVSPEQAELHIEPLVPAPDYLHVSVSHPAFTGRPTMWIPMTPSLTPSFFVTPFYEGWLNLHTGQV